MPLPAARLVVGNMMNANMTFPPELHEATENLIQNLLASELFQMYHGAQTQMDSDTQARTLLERLSTLQTELRGKQKNGSITQADIEELRAVQAQVQANTTITAYAQSQQDAVAFLREINQEISQVLGVDFAILAKQSTCC